MCFGQRLIILLLSIGKVSAKYVLSFDVNHTIELSDDDDDTAETDYNSNDVTAK